MGGWLTPRAVVDAGRRAVSPDARVSQWVFDACAGQISARDGEGRLLMAIPVNPFFGPRLAAAFGTPATGWATHLQLAGAHPRCDDPLPRPRVSLLASEASLAALSEGARGYRCPSTGVSTGAP